MPRGHALDVSGRDGLYVSKAILVGEFARQDISDDLHVLMAMGTKALSGGHTVFVDDSQIAPAHELRVVVIGKREGMKGLEPATVSLATIA